MEAELQRIKNNLNKDYFQIELPNDRFESGIYLNFIRVNNFDELFREAHNKFNHTADITKQQAILRNELMVYKALAKHLKTLITSIEDGSTKINLTYNADSKEFINSTLSDLFKIDSDLSFEAKVQIQTLKKLNQQLNETNQAVFELENYQFATYKHEELLGGGFYLRFPKETIIYKEISLGNSKFGSSILYKDESQNADKIDLLNILSFFQASPNFLLTKNKSFNEKLAKLYEQFDILDLLTLTTTKYFNDPKGEFRSLSSPIFKLHGKTQFTIFPDIEHRELFNLYHSSLKQIEPLPRCVFLFRIVEYAKNYHYQQIFQPSNVDLIDVIEYYYNQMMEHRFIPIYFLDYGSDYNHKTGELIKRRKTQYLNLMVELKKKAKQIVEYWNSHPYLGPKSLGEIIYNTGRNTVAHGGSGNQNINYDYANKYKHINDVNVFLELISRYIIEKTNPKLKNVIYRKKDMYEKNCSHLRIMAEKQNVVE